MTSKDLKPNIFHAAANMTEKEIAAKINDKKTRLKENQQRLTFHSNQAAIHLSIVKQTEEELAFYEKELEKFKSKQKPLI